ncbi:MAG: hypothetical protein V3S98_00340 [Dehalococcoidia bacterium]
MEILELIDKLEAMTVQARKVPITGRSMIDAERLAELIDQMRLTIPRDLHEAQEVIDRREFIVNQTMQDARRIRATAETDARTLVGDNELVKMAEQRGAEKLAEAEAKAERLLNIAETEARRKKAEADQYCQDALTGLEQQLTSVMATVRAGQRALSPDEEMFTKAASSA